jgi:hypothetical protein
MAEGHGGYRKPTNPAGTSGPGAYSRRTDGQPRMQLPDARYGEQAQFQQDQAGARMGSPGPAVATPAAGPAGVNPSSLTPLDAPTARPGEPVTAGAPVGPGVGPEAIGLDSGGQVRGDLEKLRRYLPAFIAQANRPEATDSFRQFVRQLRTELR